MSFRPIIKICLLSLSLSACVTTTADTMQPFSTDGCSRFPDRSLIDKSDWRDCCVVHDLAYWRGGTSDERLDADRELKACVVKVTGNKALGELMFAGVRMGGGPYYYTSYRWGYGWPFERQYQKLTPEEEALASKMEQEYRAQNPSLPCPSKKPSCKSAEAQ
jgi:hypothetical protein